MHDCSMSMRNVLPVACAVASDLRGVVERELRVDVEADVRQLERDVGVEAFFA